MNEIQTFEIELLNEKRLPVHPQETILAASLESGVPHQHLCGGRGLCFTCRVLVIAGGEHLTPPTDAECELASKIRIPEGVRLACQIYVRGGPVQLRRIIRDETDLKLVLGRNEDAPPKSLGEERPLALFFLDIRNFTPFVESNLAYDVIHILGRFHALVRSAVEDDGGRVVEVMGDGVYAVFEGEGNIDQAVASSVRAGQRILVDLETFNETYLEPFFSVRFAIGIGVHAGSVICGDVGEEGHFTALGHHVNVAARIEAATKEIGNSFLISEAAYAHLRWRGENPPSANLALKGVAGKTTVFLLGHPYPASAK